MQENGILERLILVALGWLLGLLAPIIVDAIKRRRENKLGRIAIKQELSELRRLIAAAVLGAKNHLGTTTKEDLQWTARHLSPTRDKEQIAALETLASQDEKAITTVNRTIAGKDSGTVRLQKYGTPLLDSRFAALWTFDTEAQRQLLQIKNALTFLDDAVEQSRYFNELTFKELSSENHSVAIESVRSYIDLYGSRGRQVVELIDTFLKPN